MGLNPRGKLGGRRTRCTAEMKHLTERVAAMLGSGAKKRDCKRFLKERLGCSPRTCEAYIARARAVLLAMAGTTREEERERALWFYHSVIQDEGATLMEKLQARHRMDVLLGLVRRRRRFRPSPNARSHTCRQPEPRPRSAGLTLVRSRESVADVLSQQPAGGA
jgi:hypothetical protein